jgi:imidazolonepropionase-like amidohydrolase
VSALALAVLLATSPASASTDSTFAIVDVTVIPMDRERVFPHTTVVVRGDRIVALGPAAGVTMPADAVRIDGRGKFLIPGLAEMHAHIPGGQASDVWVVPTQVLLENLLGPVTIDALNQRPEMRYVAPQMITQWGDQKRSMLADLETMPASIDRVLTLRRRLIKALHDGGVGLLLGSDAPQTYNVPGFSIHRELEVLVGAGLTPYQALETGTRNVAAFFGTLKEAGTIEVG